MTWNYRIGRDKYNCLSVIEVYYNDKKEIYGITDAIEPRANTTDELINVLEMILNDIKRSKEDIIDIEKVKQI